MEAFNFKTEREGYGREGLYFRFDGSWYYLTSVFPNVEEEFNDYATDEDCFYDEEEDVYRNSNGHEVTPIDDWDEFLTEYYKEEIGEVLYDSLWHEEYEFDFDNATYVEIADWALNY